MKLYRESQSMFSNAKVVIELDENEEKQGLLAILFNAYQIAFNQTGMV